MEDSSNFFRSLNPNVSRETIEKLALYRELIINENRNLISKGDKNLIWIRHFHDSLRIIGLISGNNMNIIDIGSGAGFPGIPIALTMNQSKNNIYLCESKKKKSQFLVKCCEKLDLHNVKVIHNRAENIKGIKFDYILSRAVAQLNRLFSISCNIKKEKTIFLFHKGIHIDKEISEATKYWNFKYHLYDNEIENGSFIFEGKNIIKSIV